MINYWKEKFKKMIKYLSHKLEENMQQKPTATGKEKSQNQEKKTKYYNNKKSWQERIK